MNFLRSDAKADSKFLNTAIQLNARIAVFEICYFDKIRNLFQIAAPTPASALSVLEFKHKTSLVKPLPYTPGQITDLPVAS